MDRRGVGDADDELVEVGAGMQPRRAGRGKRRLELRRPRGAQRGDVAQAVRAHGRDVDRRREREQGLVGADVAGGLLAPDVLLARAKGHHERPLPVQVRGHAHQPAGDLADERVGAGEDPEVRAAVLERDAQRLALARGDVRAVLARRREDGERHRLDDADEQRAGGVREAPDLAACPRAGRGSTAGPRRRPRPDGPRRRAAARAPRGRWCRRPARRRPAGRRRPGGPRRRRRSPASAGSGDGRRARRAAGRGASRGRSSAPPRRSRRRRRSGEPRPRRARSAPRAATGTRRCSGGCPG